MVRGAGIGGAIFTLGVLALVQCNGGPADALLADASSSQNAGPWAKDPPERAIEQSVTYTGCNAVRALGKAPLHAGQPGYRAEMDGDGDGVACEPHRY